MTSLRAYVPKLYTSGRSAISVAFFLARRTIVKNLDEGYAIACAYIPRPAVMLGIAAIAFSGCATQQDHADTKQINDSVEGLNFGTK